MPGLSFLLKKGWHPQTMENQKKLYMAEQEAVERAKREEEAAAEIAKEREMQQYEKMGDMAARDPRSTSLQFMYSQPKKKKNEEATGSAPSQYLAIGEEDEAVLAFRSKYEEKRKRCSDQRTEAEVDKNREIKSSLHPASSGQTDKIGYPKRGNTQTDLAERHPALKNAPLAGSYAKDLVVRHKPFNEPIRDVQCLRCGEWGHQSVDRECPMRDFNPHDWARQQREDPLTFMQNDMQVQKQKLILRHASLPAEMRFGMTGDLCVGANGEALQLVASDDDEDGAGSDPEAEFLSSLSSREKRLLLLHLENMEATGEDVSTYSAYSFTSPHNGSSDSSSSGSDDSSSDSSSDSGSDSESGSKKRRKSGGSSGKRKKKSSSHKKSSSSGHDERKKKSKSSSRKSSSSSKKHVKKRR